MHGRPRDRYARPDLRGEPYGYDSRWPPRRDVWRRAHDAGRPERRRQPEVDRRRHPEVDRRREWRERLDRIRDREFRRGFGARAREFVRRYREPIIGLTVAGAAAPIARGEGEPAGPFPTPTEAAERMAAAGRPLPGGLDEAVRERWAEEEAAELREDTIQGAMARYNISRDLAEDIYDAAVRHDIEPDIAFGLVKTESAFDHRAVSNVGARGLTQVMPRTARWLRPGTTIEDLYNRHINLELGFRYLRQMIDKYDGDIRLALLAYNRGPGTVDRVLRQDGDPDNGYADMVLRG